MEIRLAQLDDKKAILSIIKNVVIDMSSQGIDQWDQIYPNEEVVTEDILDREVYVASEDTVIIGVITLNEYQDEEYETIPWKYNGDKILVIHRLCVDPKFQGAGIATKLLNFAEQFGKENNYSAIRLDSFTENKGACRLYEKHGYEKRGFVTFRKGDFICFEKKL